MMLVFPCRAEVSLIMSTSEIWNLCPPASKRWPCFWTQTIPSLPRQGVNGSHPAIHIERNTGCLSSQLQSLLCLKLPQEWYRVLLLMFLFSYSSAELSKLPALPFPCGLDEELDASFYLKISTLINFKHTWTEMLVWVLSKIACYWQLPTGDLLQELLSLDDLCITYGELQLNKSWH